MAQARRQVGGGVFTDPEQTHPGADVARLTASALYAHRHRRPVLVDCARRH